MRVILDTNILVAALISPTGPPAAILRAFLDERFTLVTCEPQLEEFRRVMRDPELRKRVKPAEAGTLVSHHRGSGYQSSVAIAASVVTSSSFRRHFFRVKTMW